MNLYRFYRISKPSEETVSEDKVQDTYRVLRNRTFWGTTAAYSLFYLCRLSMGVVKKPMIDEGLFTAAELGVVASAFYFVYAVGKFINGFIADYCNVRRYMATGLVISSVINLLMGLIGLGNSYAGLSPHAVYLIFFLLWGLNGWVLSMGSPSGIVSLSRWFPQSRRGTFYSIFCSTPYIGEALSMVLTGSIVAAFGWEYGFIASAIGGFIGVGVILISVSDTPQSKGLPSIQEISGEEIKAVDRMPTKDIQKYVLKNPAIWIIALSCAFINLTKYGIMEWGVLYLQGSRNFSLEASSWIIGFSAIFAISSCSFPSSHNTTSSPLPDKFSSHFICLLLNTSKHIFLILTITNCTKPFFLTSSLLRHSFSYKSCTRSSASLRLWSRLTAYLYAASFTSTNSVFNSCAVIFQYLSGSKKKSTSCVSSHL